jgi:uncharacterized membrane protein
MAQLRARIARLEKTEMATPAELETAHAVTPAETGLEPEEETPPSRVAEPLPLPEPEPPPEPEPTPQRGPEPVREPQPVRIEAPMAATSPGLLERLLEGNLVAKIGVVILFFGVAFLLKYAYDRGLFPPQMRLLAVAAASAVMFFVGSRVLAHHRTYALIMLGGAMGLLYLDVFFALKTFRIIGPAAGFGLFALLGVATLLLAVRLDARSVAALGLLGGFLAPVLASTGAGQHVILFSYYLLLNLVILATSWFRSWRELNFIGFLFTFAVALLWGDAHYRPELFATVEPFLVAYFLLYLAIPILFAYRQPPRLKGIIDTTLIFGMPLSAAMMQAALTRGMGENILAWSAAIAAAVYFTLASLLWNRRNMRLLAEAHLALAVVFGTVAPYFAFRGYPSFAFWTVEGAAIYWIGCRQKRVLARSFAIFLEIAAAAYFWWVTHDTGALHPIWNDRVVGCALIAVAGFATAWFTHRYEADITAFERDTQGGFLVWASGWFLAGAWLAARLAFVDPTQRMTAMLVAVAAGLAVVEYAGRALKWTALRLVVAGHVPVLLVIAVAWGMLAPGSHPLQGGGLYAWPLAFLVHFHLVHRQLRDGVESARPLRYDAAWMVLPLLATWEALWRLTHAHYGWVLGIGVAGLVACHAGRRNRGDGPASNFILAWSLLWWFLGILGLVHKHVIHEYQPAAALAYVALSAILFEIAGRLLSWTAQRRAHMVLLPAFIVMAAYLHARGATPFEHFQWAAWIVAFVAAYHGLARQHRDGIDNSAEVQHVFYFAAALGLLAWEAHSRIELAHLPRAWEFGATGAILASGLASVSRGLEAGRWPFAAHPAAFRGAVVLPLLLLAASWTLVANAVSHAGIPPWPYLPILNPIDLAQLALFAAGVYAVRCGAIESTVSRQWLTVMAVAAFYWVNAALLRTMHHWFDVPFDLHALLESMETQAAISILWTATALVLMFTARRRASRPIWMVGATLLAVVVAKLFLHDLGSSGTVARIVSFIGVGVFMLLIGYLSPAPPRSVEAR